jgi:2,3-dihydroxyphenylpropionate 1,2-dioxygenase
MNKPGVVGGVCTAHAPQLWTLPASEDQAIVDRLKSLLGGIGEKLRALKPDVCVVVANDHAHQFLLHCTAGFTLHMGAEARGSFAGRTYSYPVASDLALDLVRHMQRNGYDPAFTSNAEIDYAFAIPLDFTAMAGPILPIYVNAYVPPQPSMERCYAFGQALADGIKALGARAVVVASGGLSHYPGTARYIDPGPDTEFDRKFMDIMAAGDVRYLLALDERRLDETGNIELRCWGVTAGMMGGRKPDMTNFEPTWHHNYGTIAWTEEAEEQPYAPHYPPVRADRVVLTETLHRLVMETDHRDRYIADPAAYAQSVDGLTSEERDALVRLDPDEMLALGLHPFVPHAFRRVLERMGLREAPVPDGKT